MARRGSPSPRTRRHRLTALGVVAVVVGLFSNVPTAGAAAADIGYRDFSYSGTSAFTPTKYSSQHKLWFNDGIWWGVLFNHTTATFDIYRLTNGSQTWNDTGIVVDDRDTSHIDVLWAPADPAGAKLYVAGVTSSGTSLPHVNRLSYDTVTNTYSVDTGFFKTIPQTAPTGAPGISIVADSNGVLWAAYMQTTGASATTGPWVATVSHSTDSGVTWSLPEQLPGQDGAGIGPAVGSADGEDIAQAVAYGSGAGASVGVFWAHEVASSATATNNGFYFSSRLDSDAVADNWTAPDQALGGAYTADNHLSVGVDETGHVLAAVKTNRDVDPGPNGSDPLIAVLKRVSAGSWETNIVLPVSSIGRPTRPYLLVDSNAHTANVFYTDPETGTSTNPRTIFVKSASLSDLSFGVGLGTAVLKNATDDQLNDVTSTSQHITAASGYIIEAEDATTREYLHACSGAPCPVLPVAAFAITPASGTAPLDVAFTDQSTGAPTSWAWDFTNDGSTDSTVPNPSHTYAAAGTYTVKLTVTNDAGSSSTTHTVVVNSASAKVTRDAGSNRYATAAAVATTEFTAPVPVAFIATGANFPDALAGAAAAGHRHGPVLLIDSAHGTIPIETQDALNTLKPVRIVVLGGTGVVSANIVTELKGFVNNDATKVKRESGGDRYATAAAVAKAEFTSPVPVAFIAIGQNFPDALAGAAAAGHKGGPVLLVAAGSNTIPSATISALTTLHPARIVVLGGTGVISSTLKAKLGAYAPSVTRESGASRYATAAAVATAEFTSPVAVAYIATAQNFPDALAGAAAAGSQGGPVLLIDSVTNTIPTATQNALAALHPAHIVVLGGTGVVSASIQTQLAAFVP
jgi:PKD repeat protein